MSINPSNISFTGGAGLLLASRDIAPKNPQLAQDLVKLGQNGFTRGGLEDSFDQLEMQGIKTVIGTDENGNVTMQQYFKEDRNRKQILDVTFNSTQNGFNVDERLDARGYTNNFLMDKSAAGILGLALNNATTFINDRVDRAKKLLNFERFGY